MVRIFSNDQGYQCWCHTTSAKSQFYYIMIEIRGLVDDPELLTAGKRCKLEKSQIIKPEIAVQQTITAIKIFANSYEIIEKDHLFNLWHLEHQCLNTLKQMFYMQKRLERKKKALQNRFKNGMPKKLFFESIPKTKLKTMEEVNKTVKLITMQGKVFDQILH